MNKQLRVGFFSLLFLLGFSVSAIAQGLSGGQTPEAVSLRSVQQEAAAFSRAFARSLPFNSSFGLNWSDSHIGEAFPGTPPHFGAGGVIGFTTIKTSVINDMIGSLGHDGAIPFNINRLPLPAYTAEGRLGGFFLPFDIGVKLGYLPLSDLSSSNFSLDHLLVGGDIRYAVLDRAQLPKVSVGIGLNYMKGGFGIRAAGQPTYEFRDENNDPQTIRFTTPMININWQTIALDFKAQVSHSFSIITPYFGLGASYGWSSTGYSVRGNITGFNNDTMELINAYLAGAGLNEIEVNSTGISSTIRSNAFSLRAFGGAAFNLSVFKLDFTALYNFRDRNFGMSLGFRFQV